MSKKFTFKEVKKYFEDHDCELLEKEYVNCKTPMKYRCNCGNDDCKICLNDFKAGYRCAKCGYIRTGKKLALAYKDVYNYFEEQGCKLLETEYINCMTKMKYICSCSYKKVSYIIFNNFRRGQRCKECGLKKRSGKNHWNWIEDREELEEKNEFKRRCRGMLWSVLKRIGQSKNDKTHIVLGYNSEDLRKHIYNHPNWEKVKDKVWHLDHYFPLQAFLDYGIRDIKLINCLGNLQPLIERDNIRKHDKYDEKEFEEWLVGKGYEIILQ